MPIKSQFADVAPWPDQPQQDNPRAVIGGNAPPPEEAIPAEFREALNNERPDFMVLLDNLLGVPATQEEEAVQGAVHRAVCTDEETLKKCASMAERLKAAKKMVDGVHRTIKEPYLTAGRLVDAERNVLTTRIDAGLNIIVALQQEYLREQRRIQIEEERKAAEERARLAELARANDLEAALPPPPPPPPIKSAPIRSDTGATVSASVVHVATVTDYAKAFKSVKNDARVREAIDKAVAQLVKTTKGVVPIPGVTISEDVKVNNR